ncbi:hypothetical protein CBL_09614 [Carabus blaptoides fortunei]
MDFLLIHDPTSLCPNLLQPFPLRVYTPITMGQSLCNCTQSPHSTILQCSSGSPPGTPTLPLAPDDDDGGGRTTTSSCSSTSLDPTAAAHGGFVSTVAARRRDESSIGDFPDYWIVSDAEASAAVLLHGFGICARGPVVLRQVVWTPVFISLRYLGDMDCRSSSSNTRLPSISSSNHHQIHSLERYHSEPHPPPPAALVHEFGNLGELPLPHSWTMDVVHHLLVNVSGEGGPRHVRMCVRSVTAPYNTLRLPGRLGRHYRAQRAISTHELAHLITSIGMRVFNNELTCKQLSVSPIVYTSNPCPSHSSMYHYQARSWRTEEEMCRLLAVLPGEGHAKDPRKTEQGTAETHAWCGPVVNVATQDRTSSSSVTELCL